MVGSIFTAVIRNLESKVEIAWPTVIIWLPIHQLDPYVKYYQREEHIQDEYYSGK